jgi:hypothetical protein
MADGLLRFRRPMPNPAYRAQPALKDLSHQSWVEWTTSEGSRRAAKEHAQPSNPLEVVPSLLYYGLRRLSTNKTKALRKSLSDGPGLLSHLGLERFQDIMTTYSSLPVSAASPTRAQAGAFHGRGKRERSELDP